MQNDPNLGLNYAWEFGESGWNVGMDANLLKLGSIVQLSVLSDNLINPPSSPTIGDRHIIADGAIDVWINHGRRIALWIDGSWQIYVPKDGWLCWIISRKTLAVFDEEEWKDLLSL